MAGLALAGLLPVTRGGPDQAGREDARAVAGHEDLRERIRGMREGVRDVPLPFVIEALSGHRVLPWDGGQRDRLVAVAAAVRTSINRSGIAARRPNEAGNLVEEHVLAALVAAGFRAGRPAGPSGRTRAAGYPDVEAEIEGSSFYVEVKTYSGTTEDSTQRTFYLSPSDDFKVTRDAHHLLLAVELTAAPDGVHRAGAVRWLDLSRLQCDLKYEFNASNRDLYAPASGLVIIEEP